MNISEYISNDSPVIIEAGTGGGEDILQYSGLYPKGKLFAFEPHSLIYKTVKENLALHNRKNVELYANALGERSGEIMKLNISDRFNEPFCSSSLLKPKDHLKNHPQITFKETIDVEIINLDDFIFKKNISFIDFLELDIQGYEPVVLKAAPNTLKATKILYTEVNLVEQYEGNILYPEYKQFLLDAGFEVLNEDLPWADSGNVVFRNTRL